MVLPHIHAHPWPPCSCAISVLREGCALPHHEENAGALSCWWEVHEENAGTLLPVRSSPCDVRLAAGSLLAAGSSSLGHYSFCPPNLRTLLSTALLWKNRPRCLKAWDTMWGPPFKVLTLGHLWCVPHDPPQDLSWAPSWHSAQQLIGWLLGLLDLSGPLF